MPHQSKKSYRKRLTKRNKITHARTNKITHARTNKRTQARTNKRTNARTVRVYPFSERNHKTYGLCKKKDTRKLNHTRGGVDAGDNAGAAAGDNAGAAAAGDNAGAAGAGAAAGDNTGAAAAGAGAAAGAAAGDNTGAAAAGAGAAAGATAGDNTGAAADESVLTTFFRTPLRIKDTDTRTRTYEDFSVKCMKGTLRVMTWSVVAFFMPKLVGMIEHIPSVKVSLLKPHIDGLVDICNIWLGNGHNLKPLLKALFDSATSTNFPLLCEHPESNTADKSIDLIMGLLQNVDSTTTKAISLKKITTFIFSRPTDLMNTVKDILIFLIFVTVSPFYTSPEKDLLSVLTHPPSAGSPTYAVILCEIMPLHRQTITGKITGTDRLTYQTKFNTLCSLEYHNQKKSKVSGGSFLQPINYSAQTKLFSEHTSSIPAPQVPSHSTIPNHIISRETIPTQFVNYIAPNLSANPQSFNYIAPDLSAKPQSYTAFPQSYTTFPQSYTTDTTSYTTYTPYITDELKKVLVDTEKDIEAVVTTESSSQPDQLDKSITLDVLYSAVIKVALDVNQSTDSTVNGKCDNNTQIAQKPRVLERLRTRVRNAWTPKKRSSVV